MKAAATTGSGRLERRLAGLLQHGTRVATLVIATGIGVDLFRAGRGASFVDFGLALFILMPVARVAVMMGVFVKAREYRFAAIAGCVLAIIALGAIVAVL